MAKHSDIRNFCCAVCQKRFKSKGSLSYHAYSHLKNGDIDSMDWFPELITPSRRKQRSENKRKNPACGNVVPIGLDQAAVSTSGITIATETSGRSCSGSNWTTPSANTTWQNYVEDQRGIGNAQEANKQQRYCESLLSPTYAARTPYVLQNNNDALPNEQYAAANGRSSGKLFVVKCSNGQQYYMRMNANLGKIRAEELQSDEPVQADIPGHWQASTNWEQGEPDPELCFLPSYGGFPTSTPNMQINAQNNNGITEEVYTLENLQQPPIGYSPSNLSYGPPFQQGYETFQSYGTDGLESWGSITENELENLHSSRSLDSMNEAVYASYYDLGDNVFLCNTAEVEEKTAHIQAAAEADGFQHLQPSTSWSKMDEALVGPSLRNCDLLSPMANEIICEIPSTSQGNPYAYMTTPKSVQMYKQRDEMEMGDSCTFEDYFGSEGL
ncbi:hypothetical protein TTRE_0000798901 [Trichuris trichiura]|uniref:C2H2-type domain-containing protein n=1 Tax=Trichuris trichiura TaxID=36087 RepID=A0A077ZH93_TRITR|nr:hypothetical protein TTRE_0000798901 [Trichuris trichiura]